MAAVPYQLIHADININDIDSEMFTGDIKELKGSLRVTLLL